MAKSSVKQKKIYSDYEFNQLREKRIEDVINIQFGMIESWMNDSTEPYIDWEFDGIKLYVLLRARTAVKRGRIRQAIKQRSIT